MICPYCTSTNITKKGYRRNINSWKQRYICGDCYRRFTLQDEPSHIEREQHNGPRIDVKIGVMDIETLPGKGYFWQLWDINIGIEQIIEDVCLLSWAGKYLNESKMYSDILTPKEAKNRDVKRVTQSAFEFISTCQFIIGHNWKQFDGKMLNNSFLLYAKPLKYQVIDTLEIARNNFKFSSNKLAYINKKLKIKGKIETEGFTLWDRCSNGDQEALDTMLEYNVGDIIATEDLYYKFRAFMPRHPNLAIYNELEVEQCPVCTSTSLVTIGRYGMYEEVRCESCNAVSRRKVNILTKEKRKSLLA